MRLLMLEACWFVVFVTSKALHWVINPGSQYAEVMVVRSEQVGGREEVEGKWKECEK
jgi:hypothetical protein